MESFETSQKITLPIFTRKTNFERDFPLHCTKKFYWHEQAKITKSRKYTDYKSRKAANGQMGWNMV